jgi:PPOX class probable F420-dependent enzyme
VCSFPAVPESRRRRGGYDSAIVWDSHPTSRRRLTEEPIGWLTTVSGRGVPSTAPVWFMLEDDGTILVYSKDPSVRVGNITANPSVTMHLEGDGRGGAIVVVNGTATFDDGAPPADEHHAFIAKYQGFLDDYGWSPAFFARGYPRPIRIAIRSIRGG